MNDGVCTDHDPGQGDSFGAHPSVFSSAVPSGSGAFQMPTRPSSSASSTLRGGGGGKGQSQKRFSNFFSFLA